MKVKVYNKKYNSVRDEFLGDIEVLITTVDCLMFPIFSKKGIEIGKVSLRLELK